MSAPTWVVAPEKNFWAPFCVENAIWLLGFWRGRVLRVIGKTIAAPCISFSLIIVKSLQLRGHRQIAKPRKYCLVHVIIFSLACVFFFFFFFHRLGIRVNSLQGRGEDGDGFAPFLEDLNNFETPFIDASLNHKEKKRLRGKINDKENVSFEYV